ncbi:MAG: DUF1127 domain-containing protein [Sneathiella sp.]|nr:DUF1127 domain-containing protein [Sneathiella sp.]
MLMKSSVVKTEITAPSIRYSETQYGRGIRLIGLWIERSRQRRALAKLEDQHLDDIGISRTVAALEINKSFWR